MRVLVIESPGKVQKLKAILGAGWDIIPSIGHIRDLPEREIGVNAPLFRPTYVLSDRGEGVVAKLNLNFRPVLRSTLRRIQTAKAKVSAGISPPP